MYKEINIEQSYPFKDYHDEQKMNKLYSLTNNERKLLNIYPVYFQENYNIFSTINQFNYLSRFSFLELDKINNRMKVFTNLKVFSEYNQIFKIQNKNILKNLDVDNPIYQKNYKCFKLTIPKFFLYDIILNIDSNLNFIVIKNLNSFYLPSNLLSNIKNNVYLDNEFSLINQNEQLLNYLRCLPNKIVKNYLEKISKQNKSIVQNWESGFKFIQVYLFGWINDQTTWQKFFNNSYKFTQKSQDYDNLISSLKSKVYKY